MATHTAMAQGSDASVRSSFEQRIGILHFVSQKEHGWHGQIRTRFTDFQVHEISKNGEVIHLHDCPRNARELAKNQAPKQLAANPQVVDSSQSKDEKITNNNGTATATDSQEPQATAQATAQPEQSANEGDSFTISSSDQTALVDLLDQDTAEKLIDLRKRADDKKVRLKDLGAVNIAVISDKAKRSQVHSEIRRIFGGRLDTSTDGDGSIKATAVGKGKQQWGTRSRNDRSRNKDRNADQSNDAKFLHFTLYKENRDTMDAIGQIARVLKLKPSFFGTAGTKDRRAVTTQRVSMRRRNPQTLLSLNDGRVRGVKIGDFKFEDYSIHLGHHGGNEFVIVAKNCYFSGTENLAFERKLDIAKTTIDSALEQVTQNGFINYYGTQRFGTHQIGTQEIGMKILKQDFEGAVEALLSFDPGLLDTPDVNTLPSMHHEDISRARACSIFADTGNARDALDHLPKRCHVEATLMQHLSKQPKDFVGALLSISRGMRTMYVHAYQSLVWNFAASKRWELFGTRVIKGDLVFVEPETSTSKGDKQTKGDDDEEMIHLADEGQDTEETGGLVAHVLTEEEATSGKYSIFDVILPSPGWDVVYPNNEIGQFYKDFMAKEENGGLDPQDMLRRQRDFSLPGSYRKLMGKFIKTPGASVQAYLNDTDQLVPTDLDLIQSCKAKEAAERATVLRGANTPQSAWQGFADNAREIDLATSRAIGERRKAEESSETPEIRAKDTWVQTSLDGSNKRVKISVQSDNIKIGGESGSSQPKGGETSTEKSVAGQTSTVEEMESVNQERTGSGSLITTLTTQRAKDSISPESQLEEQTSTTGTKDATSSNPQDGVEQSTSDNPHSTTDGDTNTVGKLEQLTPPTNSNEKKIAVIIRFALNTSQYATVVLRELQGSVPTTNTAEASQSHEMP